MTTHSAKFWKQQRKQSAHRAARVRKQALDYRRKKKADPCYGQHEV